MKSKHTKRTEAKERLEVQLSSNKKMSKIGLIELTEQDVKRINKEIQILSK